MGVIRFAEVRRQLGKKRGVSYKGQPTSTDKFNVRLDSGYLGTLSPVIKRSLILNIDSRSCNLPRRPGGIKPLGLSSGWANSFVQKYDICSSSQWIDLQTPNSHWVWQEDSNDPMKYGIDNGCGKSRMIDEFFNIDYDICCNPKWLYSALSSCCPITEREEQMLEIEQSIVCTEGVASGWHGDIAQIVHQGTVKTATNPFAREML